MTYFLSFPMSVCAALAAYPAFPSQLRHYKTVLSLTEIVNKQHSLMYSKEKSPS
jgi:hypothetical protein